MKNLIKVLKKKGHNQLSLKVMSRFLKDFTLKEGQVNIYVNPDRKDLKNIVEYNYGPERWGTPYVRFIADASSKQLFVWCGETGHHSEVAVKLHFTMDNEGIWGEADILSSYKLELNEVANLAYAVNQLTRHREDWEWLKQDYNLDFEKFFREEKINHSIGFVHV